MLFDLHNDLLTADIDVISEIKRCERALYGGILAIWTSEMADLPKKQDLPILPNSFRFAVEDMHVFDPAFVGDLLALQPAYCGLTWNYDNALAGGAFGENGLTAYGAEVIELLNCGGIAVDTAHLNEKSFYDVISKAERVINSHCFIYDKIPHRRNIKIEQARLIVERDGIVGLTPVRAFSGPTVFDYANGIAYAVKLLGEDNICVATDYHGTTDLAAELVDYSGFCVVRDELVRLGLTHKAVDKIFYLNAMKYFAIGEKYERFI